MKQVNKFTLKRQNPIPKKAKKVFQGVLYSVWQWEQKMYDGSYETFEMLKRRDGAGVIATDKRNKVLIQEETQPGRNFISIPGGQIDNPRIDPKKEALRELESETGYSSKKIKFWKIHTHSSKVDWQSYFYIAQDCFYKGPANPDPGEIIKPKWVSFDQFLRLGQNPRFRVIDLKFDLLRAYYTPAERKKLFNAFFK